jgi:hypothetical protein
MVVIGPEQYKGRKLFTTYNLENANPTAQEIGQKQFASLCRAIGVDSVDDSEELHFHSFAAKVGLGKAQNGYAARAEIKKYFFPTDDQGNAIDLPDPEIDAVQPTKPAAANDNRPASRAPAGQQQAAAAKPAGSRPWGAKK